MPDETVALIAAKEAAKELPKFEQFCTQQKLEPGSAAAKSLWKQVQQFRREAGKFFNAGGTAEVRPAGGAACSRKVGFEK